MEVTTSISGTELVVSRLRQLPEKLGRNAMRRALRKGANVIRDQARANAKTLDDPATKYNQIWKNIVVHGGGKKRDRAAGGSVFRVGVLGGARDYSAYGEVKGRGRGNPGGDTWYWRLVEFGTSEFAAKPFMRNAMSSSAEKALSTTIEAMQVETAKELAKMGVR